MTTSDQPTWSTTEPAGNRGAFRRAVESGDLAAMLQALAPDVIFHSPIVFQDYRGREAVAPLLAAVMEIFRDFRYVEELDAPDGTVLRFRARVGEREVDGVDMLTFDDAGLVRDFTVMVRPYSGATALRDAMAAKLAAHDK
ncbi:MAG TPA: nuclear transport factor 2 family protein [Ktedonobacterales bacterium]|nr:nuclear transport factor 2 family protein [Ktedonobacterales bacterium]